MVEIAAAAVHLAAVGHREVGSPKNKAGTQGFQHQISRAINTCVVSIYNSSAFYLIIYTSLQVNPIRPSLIFNYNFIILRVLIDW